MIEVSLQWTCDSCGMTEIWPELDANKKTVRAALRAGGWRTYGALDYCPDCVARGYSSPKNRQYRRGGDDI